MTNLDIWEGMEVEFGESGCHMDIFDEEWEHDYLDRILEGYCDLEEEPGCDKDTMDDHQYRMLEARMESVGDETVPEYDSITARMGEYPAPPEDTHSMETGQISGSVVRPGEDTSEPNPIEINKYAYINGGSWWLGNWVNNNNTQQGKQDRNICDNKCKNKLGCACDCTNTYDNRLVKPSTGDCSKAGVQYKRSWKEHLCWSNTNIWMNRRGSTPRTKLTGKRRVVHDTSDKITYSSR